MGVILFFVIVAVVIALVSTRWRVAKTGDLWKLAAADLGLPAPTFSGLFPTLGIEGTVDGYRVEAAEVGGDNDHHVRYRVQYSDLDLGLALRGQGGLISAVKVLPLVSKLLLGGEEVEVGDTSFDDRFLVIGDDAAAIAEFLTPTRRHSLIRLLDHYPSVRVTDTEITWRFEGKPHDLHDLASPIRRFIGVAEVLVGDDQPLRQAVDRLEAGDLGVGLSELDAIEGPLRTEARLNEAEILVSGAGSPAEVDAVLEELDEVVPRDRELAALHAGVEALREQRTDAAPVEPGADSTQVEALTQLFGGSTLAGRAVFDDKFRGRRVEWTGTVERASRYVNDLDFGAGPGTKAVVAIGAVDLGPYGVTEIDAIVQLPDDTELVVGDSVTFRGTPLKLDGFTRNIFVTDAELT